MHHNDKPAQALFLRLTIILMLFLVGCNAKDIPSRVNVSDGFVNQQVKVRVANYSNTFKNTDPISLELKYDSNNVIVLPNNYNLKIFELTNSQWVEIREKPTDRYPSDDIVLAPDEMLPAVQVIVLFPEIKDTSKPHALRIYVIGEMQTDNGNQEVAAYTDIKLSP